MNKKQEVSSTQNEQVKGSGFSSLILISSKEERERYKDYPQFPFWYFGKEYLAVFTDPEMVEVDELCKLMNILFDAFAPIEGEAMFSDNFDIYKEIAENHAAFPYLGTITTDEFIIYINFILDALGVDVNVTEKKHCEMDYTFGSASEEKSVSNGESNAAYTQYVVQVVTNYLNKHTPIGRTPQYHIYSCGLISRFMPQSVHCFFATSINQENTKGKKYNVYFITA